VPAIFGNAADQSIHKHVFSSLASMGAELAGVHASGLNEGAAAGCFDGSVR
jgi:hypothetical protein